MEPLHYSNPEAFNPDWLASPPLRLPNGPPRPRLPALSSHKRPLSRPTSSRIPGRTALPSPSPSLSGSVMSDNPPSRPPSSSGSGGSKRARTAYDTAYDTAEPGSFGWSRAGEPSSSHSHNPMPPQYPPPPPQQRQPPPQHQFPQPHPPPPPPGQPIMLPPINTNYPYGGIAQTPTMAGSSTSATGSYGSPVYPAREERVSIQPRPSSALQSAGSVGVAPMQCRLNLRQQPEVARACGFGERDRRVVDPPPVLELQLEAQSGQVAGDVEELNLSQYVVHATLFNEDGTEDVGTFLQQPRTAARRLVGSLAATPAVAADEFGHRGAYFTFADLSCREPGRYRMRFTLVQVEGAEAHILAQVMSDVFRVYTPKDFPGMRRSTPLTNALKIQGVSIPAKKGRHITMSK